MSNPTLTLSQFKIATKKAVVKETYTATVFPTELSAHTMGAELRDRVAHNFKHGQYFWYTFTRYKRNHLKDQVIDCGAIMLEYPYSMREELEARLVNLPYVHYIADTEYEGVKKEDGTTKYYENRILVALPLTKPVTNPAHYTRTASLIWEEIGLGDTHEEGGMSITYFFRLHHNSKIKLVSDDRIILDSELLRTINTGHYVDARKYSHIAAVVEDPRNTHFDEESGELFVYPDAPVMEVRR